MPPSRLGHVKLLIKNARIVNDDAITEGDIFIEDGIIRQLGKDITAPGGCETIDAKGYYVLPGGVDPHVHMDFYFMGTKTADDFYTGTKAALAGGTTTIIDFVTKREPGMTLSEAFDDYCVRAKDAACCDYGLHVVLNEMNERVESEMEQLTKRGVNSFKMFMAYKDDLMLTDQELIQAFKKCSQLGAVAQVHAENGDIIEENQKQLLSQGITSPEGHLLSRHEEIEAEATNRACVLAHQVNCPLYVVHVMSKSAADVISNRRNKGQVVWGETLGAAIGVDGGEQKHQCFRHAAAHVMSPPIRDDPTTREYLVNMIGSGALSCVASDHCTFDSPKKALGNKDFTKIPNGCNGVEERMSVLWELGVNRGRIDPCQFVAATSSNAAKIFNLYPRKGRIAVGSDADIVVWDPQLVRRFTPATHHCASDTNVFEKLICSGSPRFVIARGRVVVNEGDVHVSQGWGRLIPMPTNGQHAFARIRSRADLPAPPTELDIVNYIPSDVSQAPSGRDSIDGSSVISGHETPNRRPSRDIFPAQPQDFHSRPLTKGGSRNLQDSSFSLSGAQIDDTRNSKTSVRLHNPPGGKSHGIW